MANTFASNLLPKIYLGAQKVLREELPVLSMVSREDAWNMNAGLAAQKGQQVVINRPVAFDTPGDMVPSMTPPTPSNMNLSASTVTVDQWKKQEFGVTQEEAVLYHTQNVVPNQMVEAVRSIANQMASYLYDFYYMISGQCGTAGTGAFASDIDCLSDFDALLTRQRCPMANRFLAISITDTAAARKLAEVQQAERLGDQGVIRQGQLGRLMNLDIVTDRYIPTHTSTYTLGGGVVDATADTAVGETTINVTVTGGSGLVMAAGDPFTFSGNTNHQYTSTAAVSIAAAATGDITLNRPLEEAVDEDETLAEVTNNGTGRMNIGGNSYGFGMAFRTMPTSIEGGDIIGSHFSGVDPLSGAALTISNIPGDAMTLFRVSCAYGGGVVQPNYLARLATGAT